MPYCPDCGAEADQGRAYCSQCGAQMEGAADSLHLVSAVYPAWPTGRKMALGGGMLAAIAAFLPWFSVGLFNFTQSVNGIERGAGTQMLIAAVVVIAVCAWGWGRWQRAANGLVGGWILFTGAVFIYDPFWGARGEMTGMHLLFENAVSPDVGLYLTVTAGITVLVGILIDSFGPWEENRRWAATR